MTEFQLSQWFDLSKPISKESADITEVQMTLNAIKYSIDPQGEQAQKAVKKHNKKFAKS
jgi:hypothetical protein